MNNDTIAAYLSVFPQFVSPQHGSVFPQSIALGMTQIVVSFSVNLLIAVFAAGMAAWFARNPSWLAVQRYFTGFVLAAFAVRLGLERRNV